MNSTQILKHKIDWNYDVDCITILPECEEEHIKEMIEEGYSSGELHYSWPTGRETSGYWEIDYKCHYCGERDTKKVYESIA